MSAKNLWSRLSWPLSYWEQISLEWFVDVLCIVFYRPTSVASSRTLYGLYGIICKMESVHNDGGISFSSKVVYYNTYKTSPRYIGLSSARWVVHRNRRRGEKTNLPQRWTPQKATLLYAHQTTNIYSHYIWLWEQKRKRSERLSNSMKPIVYPENSERDEAAPANLSG